MSNKKKTSFLERLTGIIDEEINNVHSNNENSNNSFSAYSSSGQKIEVEQNDSNNDSLSSDQKYDQEDMNSSEKKPQRFRNRTRGGELISDEEGQLALDVYQTPEEIIIKSTIAGVNPNDLDISIANDMVTIRGERKNNEEVSADDYYYQECYWGKFSRSVILPIDINSDKSKATLKNGILTIRLPKVERTKAKKIKIVEE